jgi:hypothetical protein
MTDRVLPPSGICLQVESNRVFHLATLDDLTSISYTDSRCLRCASRQWEKQIYSLYVEAANILLLKSILRCTLHL